MREIIAHLREKLIRNFPSVSPKQGSNEDGLSQEQSITTQASEAWGICHFLAAISETDLIAYPLCVKHEDRPDLVLSFESCETGIEIVRAVPENAARVDAYSKDKKISTARFVPQHYFGEKKYSPKEIEDIAKNQAERQRYPHMGDEIERAWIDAMVGFAKKKAKKFCKDEFRKYKSNWLLIYDDWSPHGYVTANDKYTTCLAQQFFNGDWKNPFDKVFILTSRDSRYIVWEFSRYTKIKGYHVPICFPPIRR